MKTKALVSADGRRSRLEKLAFLLSKTCPVEQSNPRNCPLFDLRPLAARERRAWIRRLTLDELEYLSTYHQLCAADKEAKVKGRRPRKIRPSFPAARAK